MTSCDSDYTSEELQTMVSLELKLSDVLRIRSAILRRLKDAERNLKRSPEHEHGRVLDRIEGYKSLIENIDVILDAVDSRFI